MTLKFTDVAAVVVAVAVFVPWNEGSVKPRASVVPAPSAGDKAVVTPITAALAGHREQARELAAFYHSAADTFQRDGATAKVVKTTADFRTFCQRVVTLRFQGVFAKVPGLSDAIHGPQGALAKLLKLDVADLDHAKASAALDAVAWACQEAAR